MEKTSLFLRKILMRDDLQELIIVTNQDTGLSKSVIEKDYFVTKAICTLSSLHHSHVNIIFTGGTCLAKAYKLTQRMSEDIDFKLQLTPAGELLSRAQIKKSIKEVRENMLKKLIEADFIHLHSNVRNEGRNVKFDLDYPSFFEKEHILRSHIQVEFALSTLHLPTQSQIVTSIIQDTLKDKVLLENTTLPCIAIEETLAEKWVALTRRVSATERGYLKSENTLIRHLYDITSIIKSNKITDDFHNIVKLTIEKDSLQFKTQHPEYHAEPMKEIERSLSLLEIDKTWEKSYQDFLNDMLFDKNSAVPYQDALKAFQKLTREIVQYDAV
jgi:predicted nucleotidyltransferase component of viral defense system